MTLTRTDAHRPSAINPADYSFVAFECLPVDGDPLGNAQFLLAERARIRSHMAHTGGTYSAHQHGGNCHVCGSVNAIYTALFHHEPSNTYIRTGLDCTAKLDSAVDGEAFRRKVANAREQVAGRRKAAAVLADHGFAKAWELFTADAAPQEGPYRETPYEERTIVDIVGRLVKYGSVSPKALNYVGVLLDKITKRAEISAQRAAEKAAAAPVPSHGNRFTIRGEIVSAKVVESDFGDFTRIVVKHADGWVVSGRRPAGCTAVRGEQIQFDATVKVSDRDPKFGFFSRPTKWSVPAAANAF